MDATKKEPDTHAVEVGTPKSHVNDLEQNSTASGKEELHHTETYQTTNEQSLPFALYQDGNLVKVPAASRDPKDPLNLPLWHKILGLGCLSFFGALIASAELILGAALPVFALEYAPGWDPKQLLPISEQGGGFPEGSNPLSYLQSLGGPPVFDVYLLANLPVLMIGLSNLVLVPLAISVGRRPVVLGLACVAIAGAAWAGESRSLASHIGARCVQGIGAGSVESLIPFVIQDMTYVHERNTWITAAFACQGLIIIVIGFSSPYLIINLSWRWLYHLTAAVAAVFLVGVFFFLPETRFNRTSSEMRGIPRDDADVVYTPRNWKINLSVFSRTQFKKGGKAFIDTMSTFFYPSIFFVTLLNASIIASVMSAGFTAAPALLTKPWSWPFFHLGLCLIPLIIAAGLVVLIEGKIADWVANEVAKRRGHRVPENQLMNLALPWTCSLLGSLLYGLSANNQVKYHWMVFLLSFAFMAFGFLGTGTISLVYVLESYPHMAGPALVNVASFRWIIAFFLTLWASEWIVNLGYLHTFLIYTSLIAFFGLFIPVAYYYGPTWRKRFPGSHRGDQ